MATRFLLSCVCGREIPVEAGQAGDTVLCECGNRVQVPKLGQLRLLPRVQSAPERSSWSPWHGLLTLGLLVAGGSLLLGIYFWKSTPKGGPIDIDAETQRVEAFFDPLTPVETWVYWHQQTVPVAREGLKEELPPGAEQRKEEIDRGRTRQTLAFGLAGLAVLFCIGLLLWRPGRRT